MRRERAVWLLLTIVLLRSLLPAEAALPVMTDPQHCSHGHSTGGPAPVSDEMDCCPAGSAQACCASSCTVAPGIGAPSAVGDNPAASCITVTVTDELASRNPAPLIRPPIR
jgi:hypothetical protein